MEVQREEHAYSPAALALVRFGLRPADDPRILSTIQDIDRLLKTQTATGPIWHRYPKDRYGEYPDGRPFDGHGVGRGWPLLAGERAHYEIARGNIAEARRLASTIANQASECGFIPEQIWDAPDLPGRELFNGRPSGSAMPLVWAHAEYVKLRRSLRDGAIFDLPPQPVERYQRRRVKAGYAIWREHHKIASIPAGSTLRMQFEKPAVAYWTPDAWTTVHCEHARSSNLDTYYCDAATAALPAATKIEFTIYWIGKRWEDRAYKLDIEEAAQNANRE
jgi:glucoamylase